MLTTFLQAESVNHDALLECAMEASTDKALRAALVHVYNSILAGKTELRVSHRELFAWVAIDKIMSALVAEADRRGLV